MTLPSGAAGLVTREVAYLDANPETVAPWLRDGMGDGWGLRRMAWRSLAEAAEDFSPSPRMTSQAVVPVGAWSLILTNGPRGTDVGMLPSLAARELGCLAVRAVCAEDGEPGYAARILEVFGPGGSPPLLCIRSIVAADDGGKWVFETAGEPFAFERVQEYAKRRKAARFTSTLLYDYLRQLAIPIDQDPEWGQALVVERAEV